MRDRSTGSACRDSTRGPASPPCWERRITADGGWHRRPESFKHNADTARILSSSKQSTRPIPAASRWSIVCPCDPGNRISFGRWSGRHGSVPMSTEIVIRFDYGSLVPWVRRGDGGVVAIAGPEIVQIRSDVELHEANFKTVADFVVSEGQTLSFVLTWHPSHEPAPPPIDATLAVRKTDEWWREWSGRCTYQGEWREAVVRSLITLKALTYAPTGGIAAAATTSLPEKIGGVRNWDYRYCWLRDATFTLYSLLMSGYDDEARAWREWLLRAVAGKASQLNIVYGVAGERRLTEVTLDWLPGYENSAPVRIGNAAYQQFQLDVFGEVMDALHVARRTGLQATSDDWRVQRELMDFLESNWQQPDEGIWEPRGPRRHFTHSKVMAWVAFDRALKDSDRASVWKDRSRSGAASQCGPRGNLQPRI